MAWQEKKTESSRSAGFSCREKGRDRNVRETNNSIFVQTQCVQYNFLMEKWHFPEAPWIFFYSPMSIWHFCDSPYTAFWRRGANLTNLVVHCIFWCQDWLFVSSSWHRQAPSGQFITSDSVLVLSSKNFVLPDCNNCVHLQLSNGSGKCRSWSI